MTEPARPRVKICCIQDEDEARVAIAAGADAIGLVGPGLSGPEVLEEPTIARLAAFTPPGVASFLLTRRSDPDALAAQVVACGASVVQICDAVPEAAWRAVRRAAPAVRIVQVVHVNGPDALDEAKAVARHVDAVLLDSGSPAGPNPVFGGTGRTHDWALSAQIVAAVDKPVWLAGGLRPENVAQAWRQVRPFGLDLCSGVRTNGRLDATKVDAFMRALR